MVRCVLIETSVQYVLDGAPQNRVSVCSWAEVQGLIALSVHVEYLGISGKYSSALSVEGRAL